MNISQSLIELPIIPESYSLNTQGILAANGSSLNGHCSNVTLNRNQRSVCNTPASSVLFDGVIPTLTGLDGDTWASQLMILHQPQYGLSSFDIYPDFSATPGGREVGRVEVTIFNCPQWGTAVQYFTVYFGSNVTVWPTVFSCDSLLKLCISIDTTSGPVNRLYFDRYSSNHRVHIAEIAFYNDSEPCPFSTLIPGIPSPIHPSKYTMQ